MSYLPVVTDHFIGLAMSFVSILRLVTFTAVSTACTFPIFLTIHSKPWFISFIVIFQVHWKWSTIVRYRNCFDSKTNCKRVIGMVRLMKCDNSMIENFDVIKCCYYLEKMMCC